MVRQFQHQFGGKTDVHPMVLLGVTIQYVKLVGGRLSAHQCIEQVYEALRVMVGDGSPKVGEEQWTAPWPLDSVEAENEILKQRIADLEKQLGGQPAPEAG
jgi:cell division protein FtsB